MTKLNVDQYNEIADLARHLNRENDLIREVRKYVGRYNNVRKLVDSFFSGQVEELASFIDNNAIVARRITGSVSFTYRAIVNLDCPDELTEDELEEFVDSYHESSGLEFNDVDNYCIDVEVEEYYQMLPYERVSFDFAT